MVGGCSGTIKGYRHVGYAPGSKPMTNLRFTMLQKLGVPVERLGDSASEHKELSDLA